MSYEAAKKILDLVIRQGAEQNQVLFEIKPLCSHEEFERYKRMMGKSLGSMLLDVMNPIIKEFPDLKPPDLE